MEISCTHVFRVPDREDREIGAEISEKIMTKFLYISSQRNPQIQEVQQIPSRINKNYWFFLKL